MRYWLLKSEPDVFSFEMLCARGCEPWNGVRNYQARNFLRAMRQGDLALFYHSNTSPSGVAGLARIVREAYPDDLQFDPQSPYYDPKSAGGEPRWSMVDIAPVQALPRFVPLDELRRLPELADCAVINRGNRLSVLPVTFAEWEAVLQAGGLDPARLGEPVEVA
ncbi:EVE domain-containing protein [Deinococcus peraridilitoris]|uniref:EVE domain-containing protein n=1 Tax=Deinococcus peraridilitoris (strain DSM 19664 / LMG 22246 / CIP 109416 / KR-200) TaxID=937777 RepID=L0A3K0_DEIPD|nr:EVE domain-containing protein [Deinococcus peraridilitoris]AFZ68473.1 hypothetical protein Deipe_3023 [Deinococcus peraridilitoris DSM 19664]